MQDTGASLSSSAFRANLQQYDIQVASDSHIVLQRGFMTILIVVPSDLLALVGRRHAARCPPQASRVCSSFCGAQVACDLQLISVSHLKASFDCQFIPLPALFSAGDKAACNLHNFPKHVPADATLLVASDLKVVSQSYRKSRFGCYLFPNCRVSAGEQALRSPSIPSLNQGQLFIQVLPCKLFLQHSLKQICLSFPRAFLRWFGRSRQSAAPTQLPELVPGRNFPKQHFPRYF
jgi:hypothetical protein